MGSKYLIVFPLVCAISCTAGCKQRPKHEARPAAAATAGGFPIQLSVESVTRDGDEAKLVLRVEPEDTSLAKTDLATVYLVQGQGNRSPEDVLAACDKMGLLFGDCGAIAYSEVIDPATKSRLGTIAVYCSLDQMRAEDGRVRVTVASIPSAFTYHGAGTLHLWLKETKGGPVSNTATVEVEFDGRKP